MCFIGSSETAYNVVKNFSTLNMCVMGYHLSKETKINMSLLETCMILTA